MSALYNRQVSPSDEPASSDVDKESDGQCSCGTGGPQFKNLDLRHRNMSDPNALNALETQFAGVLGFRSSNRTRAVGRLPMAVSVTTFSARKETV